MTLSECVNANCPWSGKPVAPDSLTRFEGHVVGFCNPGCRDKFDAGAGDIETAVAAFRQAISQRADSRNRTPSR